MSVTLNLSRGLEWTATNSFFREICEGYCRAFPSDAEMIHELEMTLGVGGNSLDQRSPEYVAAFLTALEKAAGHLLKELESIAKDYPDDAAVLQTMGAHQRLLRWIARARNEAG